MTLRSAISHATTASLELDHFSVISHYEVSFHCGGLVRRDSLPKSLYPDEKYDYSQQMQNLRDLGERFQYADKQGLKSRRRHMARRQENTDAKLIRYIKACYAVSRCAYYLPRRWLRISAFQALCNPLSGFYGGDALKYSRTAALGLGTWRFYLRRIKNRSSVHRHLDANVPC
jgi:hypothetical protein